MGAEIPDDVLASTEDLLEEGADSDDESFELCSVSVSLVRCLLDDGDNNSSSLPVSLISDTIFLCVLFMVIIFGLKQ